MLCSSLTVSFGSEVQIDLKVFLVDPLDFSTSLMHDELALADLSPIWNRSLLLASIILVVAAKGRST